MTRRRCRRPTTKAVATAVGVVLLAAGAGAVGLALSAQTPAPRPTAAQAGSVGPRPAAGGHRSTSLSGVSPADGADGAHHPADRGGPASVADGLVLPRSVPASITIPAIGLSNATVNETGLDADGSIAVPPLDDGAVTDEPAWYDGSVTPGQVGTSIVVGHIDSASTGPADFFELGALDPGDQVDVTLQDGTVAVFTVDGVRQYSKTDFPDQTVYGATAYPSLRLITCGGPFDSATGHYLDNTVVFASLTGAHPADR